MAKITFNVAGTTFDNRRDIIKQLKETEYTDPNTISLIRDFDNPYDEYAVKVCSVELGKDIGFVPRPINKLIWQMLEDEMHREVYVVELGVTPSNYPYCSIEVEVEDSAKAKKKSC